MSTEYERCSKNELLTRIFTFFGLSNINVFNNLQHRFITNIGQMTEDVIFWISYYYCFNTYSGSLVLPKYFQIKTIWTALVVLLSHLKRCPMHQKVSGSIPGQDTYVGCGFPHSLGCVWEATDQCFSLTLMFLSLLFSLLSPLSKNK